VENQVELLCIGGILTTVKKEIQTKQVIVMRKDLNCRRGKEIAQGAHASMAFLTRQFSNVSKMSYYGTKIEPTNAQKNWLESGTRKITCYVESLQELLELNKKAKELGIESNIITDSGLTEFNGVPTITCLAIGPDYDENVDKVTGHLKLY
jgi:PTH2 family peptidyl-tRNA hydrolase